jgi:hypothetical protein
MTKSRLRRLMACVALALTTVMLALGSAGEFSFRYGNDSDPIFEPPTELHFGW